MSQETVEYLLRQQSKVQNPKSLVKVVRAHTRELKRATRREHEKAQVEALSGIGKELISGLFDVAEKGVEALGRTTAAIASNPNPLTLAAGAVGALSFLAWINLAYPNLAKAFHLDLMTETFKLSAETLAKATPEVIDEITPDLPVISGGTGQYCFRIKNAFPFVPGLIQVAGDICFVDAQARDSALQLIRDKLGPLQHLYIFDTFTRQP